MRFAAEIKLQTLVCINVLEGGVKQNAYRRELIPVFLGAILEE